MGILIKVLLSVEGLRALKVRFGGSPAYVELLECRGKRVFLECLRGLLKVDVPTGERVWFVLWAKFPFCLNKVDRSNIFNLYEARLFHELLCRGGVLSFVECKRVMDRRNLPRAVESLEDFGFVDCLRFADGRRFIVLSDKLIKEFVKVKE